jgi:hypothetical protein
MKAANYGPVYALGLYPKLAELFREHGYALAIHGSCAADFDLIAVPWVEHAANPDHVIEAVTKKFAIELPDEGKPTTKPHSRIAYKVHLSFADCALDISFTARVMPKRTQRRRAT